MVKPLCMGLVPVESKLLGGSLVCSDGENHHFCFFGGEPFWLCFLELQNLKLHLSPAVTSNKTQHLIC